MLDTRGDLMSSRDSRGLIQVPDDAYLNSRTTELIECKQCKKTKNIPKINNGMCGVCLNKLLK